MLLTRAGRIVLGGERSRWIWIWKMWMKWMERVEMWLLIDGLGSQRWRLRAISLSVALSSEDCMLCFTFGDVFIRHFRAQ